MVAVMDIAVLLERLRDAFLADKNSLMGRNGSLPFHFMNDIDLAFRVRTFIFVCTVDRRVKLNVHPASCS